jgi:phage/plasmid-associated DNA primase
MNTHIAWKEPSKFAQDKWDEYLDTFLPDVEERKVAQIALGHCLPGGNPEKIVIILMGDPNTGKSTMVKHDGSCVR